MMKILKQTILTGAVLASFMSIHDEASATAFGLGTKPCRDYLNADKSWHVYYQTWLGGYLNGYNDACLYRQYLAEKDHIGSVSCLSDKLRTVPGIGGSFDGRSSFMDNLNQRVHRACYNNPDQDVDVAAATSIMQLDNEYHTKD